MMAPAVTQLNLFWEFFNEINIVDKSQRLILDAKI